MTIIGYHWRYPVSVFDVRCSRGNKFEHAQNRMTITCPACGMIESLNEAQSAVLDNHDRSSRGGRGAEPFSYKRPSMRRRMIERVA